MPPRSSFLKAENFWLDDDAEYELQSVISEGIFSVVFKAQETCGSRLLAVKVFRASATPTEDVGLRYAAKFEEQYLIRTHNGPHILAAGNLRHSNDGRRKVELPMDFYEHDLSYLLETTEASRGLFEDYLAVPKWYHTVLTQMLEALEYLHALRLPIVHCDVAPENILYNRETHFVLADFSCAKLGDICSMQRSVSFQYLAPEVYIANEQTSGGDVWSLGIVCLDMLHLLPIVPKALRSFEKLKQRFWCRSMHQFARNCGKAEVENMVRLKDLDRYSASQMLRFLQDNPNTQAERVPATEELVYLILKESANEIDGKPSDDKLRQLASEYLREHRSNRSGSTAAELANKDQDDTAAGREQAQREPTPSSRQTSVIGEQAGMVGRRQDSRPASPPSQLQETATESVPPAAPQPPGSQASMTNAELVSPDSEKKIRTQRSTAIAAASSSNTAAGASTSTTRPSRRQARTAAGPSRSANRPRLTIGDLSRDPSLAARLNRILDPGHSVTPEDQSLLDSLGAIVIDGELNPAVNATPVESQRGAGISSPISRPPTRASQSTAGPSSSNAGPPPAGRPPASVQSTAEGLVIELDPEFVKMMEALDEAAATSDSAVAKLPRGSRGVAEAPESTPKEKPRGPRGTVGPSKARKRKQQFQRSRRNEKPSGAALDQPSEGPEAEGARSDPTAASMSPAESESRAERSSSLKTQQPLPEAAGGANRSSSREKVAPSIEEEGRAERSSSLEKQPPEIQPLSKEAGGIAERTSAPKKQQTGTIVKHPPKPSPKAAAPTASASKSAADPAGYTKKMQSSSPTTMEEAAEIVRAAEAAREEQRELVRKQRQGQASEATTDNSPRQVEREKTEPSKAAKQKPPEPIRKTVAGQQQQESVGEKTARTPQAIRSKQSDPVPKIAVGDRQPELPPKKLVVEQQQRSEGRAKEHPSLASVQKQPGPSRKEEGGPSWPIRQEQPEPVPGKPVGEAGQGMVQTREPEASGAAKQKYSEAVKTRPSGPKLPESVRLSQGGQQHVFGTWLSKGQDSGDDVSNLDSSQAGSPPQAANTSRVAGNAGAINPPEASTIPLPSSALLGGRGPPVLSSAQSRPLVARLAGDRNKSNESPRSTSSTPRSVSSSQRPGSATPERSGKPGTSQPAPRPVAVATKQLSIDAAPWDPHLNSLAPQKSESPRPRPQPGVSQPLPPTIPRLQSVQGERRGVQSKSSPRSLNASSSRTTGQSQPYPRPSEAGSQRAEIQSNLSPRSSEGHSQQSKTQAKSSPPSSEAGSPQVDAAGKAERLRQPTTTQNLSHEPKDSSCKIPPHRPTAWAPKREPQSNFPPGTPRPAPQPVPGPAAAPLGASAPPPPPPASRPVGNTGVATQAGISFPAIRFTPSPARRIASQNPQPPPSRYAATSNTIATWATSRVNAARAPQPQTRQQQHANQAQPPQQQRWDGEGRPAVSRPPATAGSQRTRRGTQGNIARG